MSRGVQVVLAIAMFLAYAAISAFLCAAIIVNPNLTDQEQYIWCAVAVGWGPVLAVWAVILFG